MFTKKRVIKSKQVNPEFVHQASLKNRRLSSVSLVFFTVDMSRI